MTTALYFAMTLSMASVAATNDNNVEWSGLTHIEWLDRSPRCPIGGEPFEVYFQSFHFDLTSARVYVNDGQVNIVEAAFVRKQGPYDIWVATVPATQSITLSYFIEVQDGSSVAYIGPSGISATAPATGWQLNYATLTHAPLGATLTSDGGAVFGVWAPNANTTAVRGAFNGWGISPMSTVDGDTHFRYMPNVTAGQAYKYFFNNNLWKEDARGAAYNPNDNNNTLVIDQDAYQWNDHDFVPPPFEEMVIYELHIGTFCGFNDGIGGLCTFRKAADSHLDHLVSLGVNVIELMPINEFDFNLSWGYNPTGIWAPEHAYGPPDDLKYFVDQCHQRGMAVIVDIVYNHFSTNGNFLWNYDGAQAYFGNPVCNTPWGAQGDFTKGPVRDYFAENAQMLLHDYHFDGFRWDATSFMRDPNGCYSEGWQLMRTVNDEIDARAIHKISIAEELPNTVAITVPTAQGGAGFDSQWHDNYKWSVRQEVFDAAFGNPEMFKIRDVILDGNYPNKTRLTRYVESHDEAGDLNGGLRLAVNIDSINPFSTFAKGRSKMAQGLTMLVPGIPLFLMGGEWMEDRQFGAGLNNRLDWAKAAARPGIIQFFQDVIGVRKANCSLRSNAGINFYQTDDTNNVIAFHRFDLSGNEIVVVASLNNSNLFNYRVAFPKPGVWYEILNSQALEYEGNGFGNGGQITTENVPFNGQPHSKEIVIPQMGLLVFRFNNPAGNNPDINQDSTVDLFDYAIHQNAFGQTGCGLSVDLHEDGRVNLEDTSVLVGALTGP